MGGFSDFLENELLDHIFGANTLPYVAPDELYIALSTADPLDTGAGIAEPAGGAYERAQANETHFAVAANGTVTNDADIDFPACTVAWGAITHFAIYDANVAGNMLAHGSLSTPKTISAGDTPKFTAGDLVVSLT